jgi:hypothetical protein
LAGAHSVPAWIFRKVGAEYLLVLHTQGHDVTVLKLRSNGFREIEASDEIAATVATIRYRFDGEKYIEYKTKSEKI